MTAKRKRRRRKSKFEMTWSVEQPGPGLNQLASSPQRSISKPEPVEVHNDILDLLVEGMVTETEENETVSEEKQ